MAMKKGESGPGVHDEVDEVVLTRSERISKRVVPPRAPLVMRKADEEGDREGKRVVLQPLGVKSSNADSVRFKQGQSDPEGDGSAVARPRLTNNVQYKFKLYSGNNSLVVLQAMRKRMWLHPVRDDVIDYAKNKPRECNTGESINGCDGESALEIDFIWEQYRYAKRYKGSHYNECVLNHIQGNLSL